ncbi:transglutaminase-like domain-containing protein [Devosia sp. CAU 1758]
MKIRAGYSITYDFPKDTPTLLVLKVHPSRTGDLLTPEALAFDPPVPAQDYVDSFGNTCTRLLAPKGTLTITNQFDIADSGDKDIVPLDAVQHTIDQLPHETLTYLLASRYCETDVLSETAWRLFEHTPSGWPRVQAILEFVHNHIRFDYALANPMRSAFGAYLEKTGVCRDYAHLAIAFCRCMNIPARYCTGYLGDIGVPYRPPMDFSAWFEVYLGGAWHTADARNLVPRIGRILMARGRDATDVAISTQFGSAGLVNFTVITDEIS